MKKGFLFDFDGVLCNSEKYHYLAWREVALSVGVSFTPEDYLPFQSTGRRNVIRELCLRAGLPFEEDRFQNMSALKSAAFARAIERVDKRDLVAGVEKFLVRLRQENVRLAIASGARTAKEMAITLQISDYFDVIVDGAEGLPPKPDPAVFLTACHKLGLTPEDCYVFEDSKAGIQAGLAGGFSIIGIGPVARETGVPSYDDFLGVYQAFFIE